MEHPIYRVTSVDHLGGYRLRVSFDDGVTRDLDLEPVLEGDLYRPLLDPAVFAEVSVDPEVHTLVWPSGADFDPAILHDWPEHESAMRNLAKSWAPERFQGNVVQEGSGDSCGKRLPTASISYSWDSPAHIGWVTDLSARLVSDGINLLLDQWQLHPGDQIPFFMEKAIRESDFVLIICTPRYKQRSNAREGGVGYEGNIVGGEVLTGADPRKFIPLLREGEWNDAAASWLRGKRYIDFRGDPYPESRYEELITAIYGVLPQAPRAGLTVAINSAKQLLPEAVTRQSVYGDYLNAALRVLQASQSRLIIRKANNATAVRQMLPDVERDLREQEVRLNQLVQEIALFSSEAVKKAAGTIAGQSIIVRMLSWLPEREAEFLEARAKLIEAIPIFSAEIRKEIGLR